jgi:hypothetical protein
VTSPNDLTPKQRRYEWGVVIVGAVTLSVSPLLMLSIDTASALPFAAATGGTLIASGLIQLYYR